MYLSIKNGRNTAVKFIIVSSGRPRGARNKKTLAIESLLEGQAEILTQTAITNALDRDSLLSAISMDF